MFLLLAEKVSLINVNFGQMNLNKFIVVMILLSSYCSAQTKETAYKAVQTKEIQFENLSFEALKAKAKKEKKLIFINVYMTNCIPCKDMERDVFTDGAVADFYNPQFINASYNYNEKEGQEVSEIYDINCFPHFLFMDGDGKIVHSRMGFVNQQDFVKLAQIASNPKERLLYYEEEYPNRKADAEFLLQYLRILNKAKCVSLEFQFSSENSEHLAKLNNLLKEYFALQPEEMLTSRVNWNAINDFTYDYKSREFSYLLKNAAAFKKLYTEDSVNSKIKDVLINEGALHTRGLKFTEANEMAYIDEIKKLNTPEAEPAIFWLRLRSAKSSQKWPDYMRLVTEAGNKFIRTAEEKEMVSKVIYENIADQTALEQAEQLMKSAVETSPSWTVYETYANVLFKLNKKNEAKSMALKGIDTAKRIGAKPKNYESLTYLLEKIEKL